MEIYSLLARTFRERKYGDTTPYSLPAWGLRYCHISPRILTISKPLLGYLKKYTQHKFNMAGVSIRVIKTQHKFNRWLCGSKVVRFGMGRLEIPLTHWVFFLPTWNWIGRWTVLRTRIRPWRF
jgi:hypothetical protein